MYDSSNGKNDVLRVVLRSGVGHDVRMRDNKCVSLVPMPRSHPRGDCGLGTRL